MILIDREIRFLLARQELVLEPCDLKQVQPASIDLRLDSFARVPKQGTAVLDPGDPDIHTHYEDVHISDAGYVLEPRGILIAQTAEYMRLPDTCMGRIAQRSSLLRLGVHVSSSLINPGYAGHLPCLVQNLTMRPLRLFAGLPFCQLILHRCMSRPDLVYHEKGDAKYHEERPFRPSAIASDVHRWVKPAPRPLRPEQAAHLKVELLEC